MRKNLGLSVALAAAMGLLIISTRSSVALAETPVPTGQSISVQATEPPSTTLTVLGQITNGTPGGSLPVTMTVTLYAVDGQALAFNRQGTADSSGKVRYHNVDHRARRAYALAAGKALTFDLSGTPKLTTPVAAPGATANSAAPAILAPEARPVDRRLLGEGVVVVGLLAILAACIWRILALRSRPVDGLGQHRALLEALADLDEDHEASRIGDADYADQRQFLKAALLAALQSPPEATDAATEA